MSRTAGPTGAVCVSIARTPNVTWPSVAEIRRSRSAIAIK